MDWYFPLGQRAKVFNSQHVRDVFSKHDYLWARYYSPADARAELSSWYECVPMERENQLDGQVPVEQPGCYGKYV